MNRFLSLVVLVTVLSTLNGCAFMSDEDRDFYGRGWVKPTDLDQQYPHHSGTPKDDGSSAVTSSTSDPAHDSGDTAWSVPNARPQ